VWPSFSQVPFQSTRPRGARRQAEYLEHYWREGFNPRARVGRDDQGGEIRNDKGVSIHAPAWGATRRPAFARSDERCFNPRARVGRDIGYIGGCAGLVVSIHAPAWGATPTLTRLGITSTCFNPRARVGRDIRLAPLVAVNAVFQSTRPRGARRCDRLENKHLPSFNPRARVGRDFVGGCCGFVGTVSIHAPAWGATVGGGTVGR